jgi:hypothetical protein
VLAAFVMLLLWAGPFMVAAFAWQRAAPRRRRAGREYAA